MKSYLINYFFGLVILGLLLTGCRKESNPVTGESPEIENPVYFFSLKEGHCAAGFGGYRISGVKHTHSPGYLYLAAGFVCAFFGALTRMLDRAG